MQRRIGDDMPAEIGEVLERFEKLLENMKKEYLRYLGIFSKKKLRQKYEHTRTFKIILYPKHEDSLLHEWRFLVECIIANPLTHKLVFYVISVIYKRWFLRLVTHWFLVIISLSSLWRAQTYELSALDELGTLPLFILALLIKLKLN